MPTAAYASVEQSLFEKPEIDEPFADIETATETCLQLGYMAMRFARVERVPRYDEASRENDAEHSFMLALVAPELARQHFPTLDTGLISQFSTIHDLIELETGDVATFTLDTEALNTKEAIEHAALERLLTTLPPHTAELLRRYERQLEPEARFVRLVDKILPVIVDILGPGAKVMQEDYHILTTAQLDANEDQLRDRLRSKFPDGWLRILHLVRDELAERFSADFAFETTF